jgi:hypothetical protein
MCNYLFFFDAHPMGLAGRKVIVLNTHELTSETSDEKRFKKSISASLKQVGNLVHDGLFTYVFVILMSVNL